MRTVALFLCLSCLCFALPDQYPSDQGLFEGKFRIEFDGDCPVTSFSGGGVTFDKREVTEGERAGLAREYTISKVNWANIVIEKNAVQGDTKWKDWFESEGRGQNMRKSISIVYLDRSGAEALRATYSDCYPVSHATVVCLGPCGSPEERERLEIGVRSGEFSAEYVAEHREVSNEVAIGRPRFDLKGVPETGRWWSISGGDSNVEIVTYTTGPDQHEQKRPGQMYFSDITIKGPFVKDRKAVMDWVNGAAKGKRERVDMTLAFQNDAGCDMQTYSLSQCIPISFQPPAVSSGNYDLLEESLTIHVMEVRKQ